MLHFENSVCHLTEHYGEISKQQVRPICCTKHNCNQTACFGRFSDPDRLRKRLLQAKDWFSTRVTMFLRLSGSSLVKVILCDVLDKLTIGDPYFSRKISRKRFHFWIQAAMEWSKEDRFSFLHLSFPYIFRAINTFHILPDWWRGLYVQLDAPILYPYPSLRYMIT